jgi:hypothetical protein
MTADPASHTAVMSSIIEELTKNKSLQEVGKDNQTRGCFSQSPLTTSESEGALPRNAEQKRTFSVDPQEAASGLPFDEDLALKEPHGSSFVVSHSQDIVI